MKQLRGDVQNSLLDAVVREIGPCLLRIKVEIRFSKLLRIVAAVRKGDVGEGGLLLAGEGQQQLVFAAGDRARGSVNLVDEAADGLRVNCHFVGRVLLSRVATGGWPGR